MAQSPMKVSHLKLVGTAAPVTLVDVSITYATTGGLVCDLQLPDTATIKQVKLRLWEMHGYTGVSYMGPSRRPLTGSAVRAP